MIYLFEDFYIDADDYCYALIRKGKKPKREFGSKKVIEGEYTDYKLYLGFYNTVENALKGLCEYKIRTYVKGSEMQSNYSNITDLLQYVKSIKEDIENMRFE